MSLSSNFPTVGPVLNLDFVNNQALDPRVTFTRASTATYFDYAGILRTAQNDTPRFDYNPSTLVPQGLLIEESRTNSIRNNTMVGAVAGTPGTLPTNWTALATAGGLTREIVGIGTVDGIPYIDIRYSGTTTDANSVNLAFDTNLAIAASSGQTWTSSSYVTVVGGNFTNITSAVVRMTERTGAGSFVGSTDVSFASASGALRLNRFSATRTLGATAGAVQGNVFLTIASGVAIDITLRIGLPQLELGAFATSVIPTSTVAVTRQADAISMTGTAFSGWYNALEGMLFTNWTSFIPNGVSPGSTYAAGFTDNLASTGSAQLVIQNRAVSNQIRVWQSTTGGGLDDFIVLTTTTFQGKAAAVYGGAANVTASANGGAVVTMANPIQTTIFNALTIGSASGTTTTSGILNGHIQRISYYPLRNTNAQLQALTGT